MSKITFVDFRKGETIKPVYSGIWQWSYGQVLRIQGLDLPSAIEIHFSLDENAGEAKRRIGITNSGVTDVVIPDFILEGYETAKDHYHAYAFIYPSDEESGETTHKIIMKIKTRPRPEGTAPSDETTFSAIVEEVRKIAERTGGEPTEEQIAAAVEKYMTENPVEGGSVTVDSALSETSTNPVQNKVLTAKIKGVSQTATNAYNSTLELTKKTNELSEQIGDLKENGTGATVTSGSVKTILSNIMTIMRAQVNPDGTPQVYNPEISAIADMTDELIANLGTTEEEPDEPINPDVTLSSISVIYTGGSVPVGTALSSLKGITVTATYSDGSTAIVSGYTLSGEIAEGSNTITVSYNGLTTTFIVTGIVEESGANETTAWDNASEYSFGGIVKNVRNAKATGTFAYQTISTEYIQMFNTGLGDDWNGIVIIGEETTAETKTNRLYTRFMYINKDGHTMCFYKSYDKIKAGTVDLSNDDYFKIENGNFYAKSLYTSVGYQPFEVGKSYRWFAW